MWLGLNVSHAFLPHFSHLNDLCQLLFPFSRANEAATFASEQVVAAHYEEKETTCDYLFDNEQFISVASLRSGLLPAFKSRKPIEKVFLLFTWPR